MKKSNLDENLGMETNSRVYRNLRKRVTLSCDRCPPHDNENIGKSRSKYGKKKGSKARHTRDQKIKTYCKNASGSLDPKNLFNNDMKNIFFHCNFCGYDTNELQHMRALLNSRFNYSWCPKCGNKMLKRKYTK